MAISHRHCSRPVIGAVVLFAAVLLLAGCSATDHEHQMARKLQAAPAPCTPGFFKSGNTCKACLTSAQSPSGATKESDCFCPDAAPRQYYNVTVGCVTCDATTTTGASLDGKTCPCANTTTEYRWFNPATNTCRTSCDDGSYYAVKEASCKACNTTGGAVTTAEWAEKESACACAFPGSSYYKEGAGCAPCADTVSTTGASTDGQSCVCSANYTDFSPATGSCRQLCASGTYRNRTSGACDACLGGTPGVTVFTNTSEGEAGSEKACYCSTGFYYAPGVGCKACDATTTTGATEEGSRKCVCLTGFKSFNATTGACAPNTNCASGSYYNGTACTKCAGTVATKTRNGAVSEADCGCASPNNYYAAGVGCKACATASTTGKAAADGRSCPCKAGYYGFNATAGTCSSCASGSYLNVATSTCVACNITGGVTPTTAAASTSETACTCPPAAAPAVRLYYKSDTGCVACAATVTSGKSLDGKSCTCSPTTLQFVPSTNTCCAKKNAKCSATVACCSGLTCTGGKCV